MTVRGFKIQLIMAKKKIKEICANCGSDKVQTKMWVEINTNEVKDVTSDGESEDNWCPDCETHCDINTI